MIYSPEEDSYLLQEVISKSVRNKNFLDMGAGSGIISITAKNSGAKSILSADIDEESINFLKSKGFNAIKTDLFAKIGSLKFDVISFNPPYLPLDKREDLESQRATTGGKKGDEIPLRFIKQASKHLTKEGVIFILLSSLTPKKRLVGLIKELGLSKRVVASKKIFMESLEVWRIKPKHSNQ